MTFRGKVHFKSAHKPVICMDAPTKTAETTVVRDNVTCPICARILKQPGMWESMRPLVEPKTIDIHSLFGETES